MKLLQELRPLGRALLAAEQEIERLRQEIERLRELADGYSADFAGTDAGIKFAVIASRADKLADLSGDGTCG